MGRDRVVTPVLAPLLGVEEMVKLGFGSRDSVYRRARRGRNGEPSWLEEHGIHPVMFGKCLRFRRSEVYAFLAPQRDDDPVDEAVEDAGELVPFEPAPITVPVAS